MATPKVPIVRGKYPIPYKNFVDRKKTIRRSCQSSPSSSSSSNSVIEHMTSSSEDDGYGEDEYIVEKILSHRNRPDGRYQYFLKWKDYPDTENSWEDEENVYATELLEAYWRNNKSTPQSNGYKGCVSSQSKTTANGKSNRHQVKGNASSNNKESSPSHTVFCPSNGISNKITNSLSEPASSTNDNSIVKYRKEYAKESNSFKGNGNNISTQRCHLKILNKNDSSMTQANGTNESENHGIVSKISCDSYNEKNDSKGVNDQAPTIDVSEESSSESEPSDSDATIKDSMEIDEEEENDDREQDSNSKPKKAKLGPRKPKSRNRIHEKESLYDDRGVKSIIRNIDENWDPYIEEVVAIEPHDKRPNVLWIYISWRGGFTSVHLNTEVNKLCPQSIIKFYEKRIIFKGDLIYKN
ncbi:hypothetical protein C1645_773658 [Glomus cerebriforme]|uniref:Chromo domain-containing protein n=1 Tax=Glomus cerebriforme TaxID=658196 RepID=A0A397SRW7_9GLOM|nr:hypothetical protein C1645_773658 [Glomus cerebriforme]